VLQARKDHKEIKVLQALKVRKEAKVQLE